ncbi:MAG: hypothetical protein H6559_14545 [Lewinellaceae bacterium]|nr:hypothetical protein [Lewinellaceae bacterium]
MQKTRVAGQVFRNWAFTLFVCHLAFVNIVYVLGMRSAGQWQDDPEGYLQQARVSEYISESIEPGEYVYWIGEESFFGNFLFGPVIFPVKVTPCMIIRNDEGTIDFSAFPEQMNSGAVRYLILDGNGTALEDNCFGQPFLGFRLLRACAEINGTE